MIYKDTQIIDLLKLRDNKKTIVRLKNNKSLVVWNIAWGYDMGDEYAHLTTNVSPSRADATIDFIFTNTIVEIIDPEKDEVIFKIPNGDTTGFMYS